MPWANFPTSDIITQNPTATAPTTATVRQNFAWAKAEIEDLAQRVGGLQSAGPPPTGATGPSGASGVHGVSGATGATGPSGTPGTVGATGPSGTPGASGASGTPGSGGLAQAYCQNTQPGNPGGSAANGTLWIQPNVNGLHYWQDVGWVQLL